MNYTYGLLLVFIAFISCNTRNKENLPSALEVLDSAKIEQEVKVPPLTTGNIEYNNEEAFGEVIELEGKQIIPNDSFIFQPREPKIIVKENRLVMKVFSYGKDAHPFLIFNYPEMTFIKAKGIVGPGPDEFRFPNIIPTEDSMLLCYLFEATNEKLYQLDLNGNIIPYPFKLQASKQNISQKTDIYNLRNNDFIYVDESPTGRSIIRTYQDHDSVYNQEIYSLQLNPNMKSSYAYIGDFIINPEQDRMVYIYKYFKALKFMNMDASSVKTINYNLKEFDSKTLRLADGLDKNITYYWGIMGGKDYVYCAYSGRTPIDVAKEKQKGNTYIYIEQYDWNGNPIKKYKLKDFFGKLYVDEERKTILGINPDYDDPFVEFQIPE